MKVIKFIVIDKILYSTEKEPQEDACKGCAFTGIHICDEVDCSGVIYKEAGLKEILEILALANKEE